MRDHDTSDKVVYGEAIINTQMPQPLNVNLSLDSQPKRLRVSQLITPSFDPALI